MLLAVAALASLSIPGAYARSRTHHSDSWARERFTHAERVRDALDGRPLADRTRHDYQRVLDAYRSVYKGAPSSSKAEPSVVAVAETLVEMGRKFQDDRILKEAIGQYKFLRREYPGSKYRFDSLFTIAEIYKQDLNNSEAARATFQEFLRRYPNHHLAGDARQGIAELNLQAHVDHNARTHSVEQLPARGNVENREITASETPAASREGLSASGTDPGLAVPQPVNSKRVETTIVKKIVDADDDDLDHSAKLVKRIRKNPPAARSKSLAGTGEDSKLILESGSGSGNNPATSPHRVVSRTLASSSHDSTSDLSREAIPTSSGDRSLIRALGLKIGKIVIDPGHGGHDAGTIGPNGLEEKDLVLEVGRRLGKLLETRLGAEVVYTRRDDTFIPLETRTAIANKARADLFVSIHANSSHDAAARGVETYYLNFTSSPEALEVAARENAVSEKSIFELQDLVKKIALKDKIEESREFASDVQQSLHTGLSLKTPAIRDRGVKKAPFIVLIGAHMPSILAEISFVSNPTDEHRLATSEYRQRIAESLYHGIAKYVSGLSGVKVASKMEKTAAQ